MRIYEPNGIMHDTTTNLNFIDLKEPFEQYARPMFPRLDFDKIGDPVKYFRKVLLLQWYNGLLAYVIVDEEKPRLKTKKEKKSKVSSNMKMKADFLLETYASKDAVRAAMKSIKGGKPAGQFFDEVYEIIKKRIKSDMR